MLICLSCSILCSSNKPPFNVRNFLANCLASTLVSIRPSSRRFSLCMDSSDSASTFSSISSNIFCSSRRREAISNMMSQLRHWGALLGLGSSWTDPLQHLHSEAAENGELSHCCPSWPNTPASSPMHITTNPSCTMLRSIHAYTQVQK